MNPPPPPRTAFSHLFHLLPPPPLRIFSPLSLLRRRTKSREKRREIPWGPWPTSIRPQKEERGEMHVEYIFGRLPYSSLFFPTQHPCFFRVVTIHMHILSSRESRVDLPSYLFSLFSIVLLFTLLTTAHVRKTTFVADLRVVMNVETHHSLSLSHVCTKCPLTKKIQACM